METEKIFKPMKKITGILDILICLLLFISALYKGGFYKEDSLFVNMIICMIGLVCLTVKIVLNLVDNRKITKSKMGTIIDICVILIPIAYFLPLVFNTYASKESAIFECIRYVNFALIYFIARSTYDKKIYLTSIVIIGVGLAILGIDEISYRLLETYLSPVSISYLDNASSKISSTLQYANITALFMLISSIILQFKLKVNLNKMYTNNTLKDRILVIAELFCLVLLQSAIVLTTSRMNMLLMIVTTIIYAISCFKTKEKKIGVSFILILLSALILVTSIDNYLIMQNNFMICFTYIVTLLIITLAVILSNKFKVITKNNTRKLDAKKIVIICIIFLITLAVIFITPDKLRINDKTKTGTIVTRNIYKQLQDSIELEVDFKFNRNDSFVMELYEVDEDFNKKMLVSITKKSVKEDKFIQKINLSKNAESLMFTLKAIDSDISIESLKLNGKKVTLSYMFMPDSIMFRLKDTFIKDSNNSLRAMYYMDALKLFNKSKLVGIGGEGFKARYQEVQSKPYVSSEVHSVPLQILVESGLVGFTVFMTLLVIISIITYRFCKDKKQEGILYSLILIVFIATSLFDLVFSFGIMIYLFAVIIGLIVNEYKKESIYIKDKYELDNKSMLGMIKIATLSISLMALFIVTIYSVNIYRASMIVLPEETEELNNSYERVGLLENKIKLDKYNISYLNSLISEYDKHISMLSDIYILTKDDSERFVLKTEINNYIARQKEIADNVIEYEYYNKYAIENVARCYFKRYVIYAELFNNNFKNDEIAYVFYIGYGIKLTERLLEIGKVNKLANEFAYDIYSDYIPVIEKQNKIINSEMLSQALEDMKIKFARLENVK